MPLTCLARAITGAWLRSNLSPVAQEEHQELPLLTLRSIDFHELWGDGGFASRWRTWSRRRVRLTEHDLWRSVHATGRTHSTLTNKIQWWVWVTRSVKWLTMKSQFTELCFKSQCLMFILHWFTSLCCHPSKDHHCKIIMVQGAVTVFPWTWVSLLWLVSLFCLRMYTAYSNFGNTYVGFFKSQFCCLKYSKRKQNTVAWIPLRPHADYWCYHGLSQVT